MTLRIRNNQTLLFIGDSITDCRRRTESAPLGDGYVKMFNDLLIMREPKKSIRIINKGISGEKIKDLRNRWNDDVLRHKPDWLSVKIGINDLHHQIMGLETGYPVADYRTAYDEVLAWTKKALPKCRILLIDPFYISQSTAPSSFRTQVLQELPQYIKVVREMSKKYDTLLVKTHDIFQKLLKHHEAETFCPEPVHPNLTGHLVIAEQVYATLSSD